MLDKLSWLALILPGATLALFPSLPTGGLGGAAGGTSGDGGSG